MDYAIYEEYVTNYQIIVKYTNVENCMLMIAG